MIIISGEHVPYELHGDTSMQIPTGGQPDVVIISVLKLTTSITGFSYFPFDIDSHPFRYHNVIFYSRNMI